MKSEALWRDEYPAWQDWADECESLLKFLSDGGALERFWPRLCSKAQQRDETINEIRVAYFLHLAGYPVIDWEPQDAGGRKLEYAVAISQQQKTLVEVQSPGWEAELSESERVAGRASQPKYRADTDLWHILFESRIVASSKCAKRNSSLRGKMVLLPLGGPYDHRRGIDYTRSFPPAKQ